MNFNRFSWWDFDKYYKTLRDNDIEIFPYATSGLSKNKSKGYQKKFLVCC